MALRELLWVAVSVSFVSPFNLRYAESNRKTRILGYRFLSACCSGKLSSVGAHVFALPCPVSRPSPAQPSPAQPSPAKAKHIHGP
ncbi:hypothetical protein FVER53590_29996 [Fusarium verticillioides]|nr:hypothetical protein FVER53590_29996 [Fusarium verticillioides]